MSNEKSFDISGHQRRPPLAWFQALAADGHKLGVIQLWGSQPGGGSGPNADAQYQIAQTIAAGMLPAGYIVIPVDSTVNTDQLIKAGLGAAGRWARDLVFVAADIESNQPIHSASPGLRLSHALADIRKHGLKAIIYTSRSKWPLSMGSNSTAFNRVPLWDAAYLDDSGVFKGWGFPANLMGTSFIPYGGWDQRAMWQLAGTVQAVPGYDNVADLNLADFARLGITEEVDTDMPDPRVDDILTRLDKVEGQAHGHPTPAPAPTPAPSPPAPSPTPITIERTHTVVAGDIAGLIAEKYGMSLDRLKALNPGKPNSGDWSLIYPGEVFRIA